MRKIYLLASLFVCLFVLDASAGSGTGTSTTNKTYTAQSGTANFGGKKFYINPGHGGHSSDDRPTAMPLGVAMFYESDANLTRSFYLRDFLYKNNANVRMSRESNTDSDDLPLSTIASYSSSYGGYFISLHSNGANASANYVVSFYRTTSSAPSTNAVAGSYDMAYQGSIWHDAVNLTNETYNTPRALGCHAFYGYNLGVLGSNSAVGYLVESWFHDYRPESLRMKSDAYNKFLAWQIARAAMVKPGATGTLGSVIVGDIRDLAQSCGYTSYTTRGRDAYLAINGATVNLYDSTGATQLQTMTTDNCCNGVYAFFVDAGTYYVEVKKDGYKTQKVQVTVGANAQVKQLFSLTAGADEGISASAASVDFSADAATNVGTSVSKSFTVTGEGLTSSISVVSSDSQFSVSPTSLPAAGGTVTVTYTPTAAGSHTASITITSGDYKTVVVAEGTAKNPPLTFTEVWNYSETSAVNAADGWTADKTLLRNMCYGDGKLYVVATSSIKVIDAKTGAWIKDLDITGVSGGWPKLCDVEYIDGKIVATNYITNPDTQGALKVYVWDNDNAAPRVFLETTDLCGFTAVGATFNIKGDLNNGTIYYAAGGVSDINKIVSYDIVDGVASTTANGVFISEDGTEEGAIALGYAPRVVPDENGKMWITGQNYYPVVVDENGIMYAALNPDALGNDEAGNAITPFEFKGTQYAFATRYTASSVQDERLRYGRAVLVDATDGWANAESIGEYPTAGLGSTRNTLLNTAVEVAVNGDQGVDMWVLVQNQGIAHYAHGTAVNALVPKLYVSETAWSPEKILGDGTATKTIEVNGVNLTGDVSLALSGDNADMYSIDVTSIDKDNGYAEVEVTYAPTATGTHAATITVTTDGTAAATIALNGTCKPNTYLEDNITEMTEVWNYSETGENAASAPWLDLTTTNKTTTRFIAFNDGKLYVLNCAPYGVPTVNIVNAYTGEDTGEDVNLTGVSGGITALSSIRFVDGVLVGANAAAANHTFTVYAWKDGVANAPTKILEDASHGSLTMGSNITISGNLTNGRIWTTDDACNNVLYYAITGGVVNTTPTVLALTDASGNALSLAGSRGASPVIPNEDGTFWVDGQSSYPRLFDATGKQIGIMQAGALNNNTRGTALEFFDFGEKKYAAAVAYSASSQTNGYFTLIDVTDGATSASSYVAKYPSEGLGTVANAQNMSSICQSTRDEGHTLDIWVCCALQGVAHYSYAGRVEIPTGVEEVGVAEAEMKVWAEAGVLNVAGVEAAEVNVYSISGALVANAKAAQQVNVAGLPAGIYVVAVVDVAGNVHTAKIAYR